MEVESHSNRQAEKRAGSLVPYSLRVGFAILPLVAALAGCAISSSHHSSPADCETGDNPTFIPAGNSDLLWSEMITSLERRGYRIEREERVRLIGDVVTEGRIETFPAVGSTLLEPWRGTSAPGYERLHATLQTVRRRVVLRVIPATGGYLVEATVFKELEDLIQPELATVGGSSLRHDGSLVRERSGEIGRLNRLGWIPQGRDVTLEHDLLSEITARAGAEGISPVERLPPE